MSAVIYHLTKQASFETFCHLKKVCYSIIFTSVKVESMCNGCMPVRAVCKPHSPDLKRGALALATDARGCSLWRTLLERPPPAPESRVRDPLGEWVRTRVGGVTHAR